MGFAQLADASRVREHFERVGLPATLGELGLSGQGERLAAHMVHDKKREGGRTAFILARGIGQAFVDKSIDLTEVADFLNRAA